MNTLQSAHETNLPALDAHLPSAMAQTLQLQHQVIIRALHPCLSTTSTPALQHQHLNELNSVALSASNRGRVGACIYAPAWTTSGPVVGGRDKS